MLKKERKFCEREGHGPVVLTVDCSNELFQFFGVFGDFTKVHNIHSDVVFLEFLSQLHKLRRSA